MIFGQNIHVSDLNFATLSTVWSILIGLLKKLMFLHIGDWRQVFLARKPLLEILFQISGGMWPSSIEETQGTLKFYQDMPTSWKVFTSPDRKVTQDQDLWSSKKSWITILLPDSIAALRNALTPWDFLKTCYATNVGRNSQPQTFFVSVLGMHFTT